MDTIAIVSSFALGYLFSKLICDYYDEGPEILVLRDGTDYSLYEVTLALKLACRKVFTSTASEQEVEHLAIQLLREAKEKLQEANK